VAGSGKSKTIFERWCTKVSGSYNGHSFDILAEKSNVREKVLPEIVSALHDHYDGRERFLRRVERLGYDRAVNIIRERLPATARSRSGDLGEMLATEYVRAALPFIIPINRLQWKDGRNMALRGDDLIGFRIEANGKLEALLKGESKSRASLGSDAMADAILKLREYDGRPSPHTLLYTADRLHELGQSAWAEMLEDYALLGESVPITHLIFTLSGNPPVGAITTALSGAYLPGILRQMVGLIIVDHGDFIDAVFEIASV
jgi:hypothetical protein